MRVETVAWTIAIAAVLSVFVISTGRDVIVAENAPKTNPSSVAAIEQPAL